MIFVTFLFQLVLIFQIAVDGDEEGEKPQILLGDFCLYEKHGHLGKRRKYILWNIQSDNCKNCIPNQ